MSTNPNAYATRIQRVVDYLAEHLDDPLELETLARVACFSPYHFHRIYRGLLGEAVHDTVRRLRLQRAAIDLLDDKLSIERTARRAGFGSQAAFTRAIGIFYDDPDAVPQAELRSAACMTVPADWTPSDGLAEQSIAGGHYARIVHTGPYAELKVSYDWLYQTWLPASGEEPRDLPTIEEYLNDAASAAQGPANCHHAAARRTRMNLRKLKEAEAAFLARFPQGFDDPGMERIRKSHPVDRLAKFTRANVTELTLGQPTTFADTLVTVVGRSSMVSRFEKPLFRAFIESLDSKDKRRLADAYLKRLFGRKKREGFEEIVELFGYHKLARWSLVSALPFYFAPTKEAFVKPSTAKRIVSYLEIGDLHYHARPDWAFYDGYRKLIDEIKKRVSPSLTPNNAAATGFFMATL